MSRQRLDPHVSLDQGAAVPSSSPVRVRPMVAEDVPQVIEIERRAFSTPWSGKAFRDLLEHDEVLLRVLEVPDGEAVDQEGEHRVEGSGAATPPEGEDSTARGAVAGYAVTWALGREGELANFALAERYRGRGLASWFLDALLAEIRERGVRTLFLEVRASNEPALRLYRTIGFQEVGRRSGYYTHPPEDALIMLKEL